MRSKSHTLPFGQHVDSNRSTAVGIVVVVSKMLTCNVSWDGTPKWALHRLKVRHSHSIGHVYKTQFWKLHFSYCFHVNVKVCSSLEIEIVRRQRNTGMIQLQQIQLQLTIFSTLLYLRSPSIIAIMGRPALSGDLQS